MIRRAISGFISLVIIAVFAYLFFFVPLGERTLYEHASRIAATPEAEELGRDATRATDHIEDVVRERLGADASVAARERMQEAVTDAVQEAVEEAVDEAVQDVDQAVRDSVDEVGESIEGAASSD